MENTSVKFRRGGPVLPQEIKDGYITLDKTSGKLYADIVDEESEFSGRRAISGYLFGVSETPANESVKIVEISGIPEYFDGMVVTVVFKNVDNGSIDYMKLSVTSGGITLPAVYLMVDKNVHVCGVDIKEGVPYSFAYEDGEFTLVSGNLDPRPKWKGLTD